VGYASTAVGTINFFAEVVRLAKQAGALSFIDAVHYAPHGPIDVRALDCDFLVCSPYKFFGPHSGTLYGKREHLERLRPYKVRPATDELPGRWMTGTQSHEAMAGVTAALDYLVELGRRVESVVRGPSPRGYPVAEGEQRTTPNTQRVPERTTDESESRESQYDTIGDQTSPSRRAALLSAMRAIRGYERALAEKLIAGLLEIPGLTFYGIRDPERLDQRTPTVAVRMAGHTPREVAELLGERGVFTWDGNYYALNLTERLGVEQDGGMLRIGLVHYNTSEEIERLLAVLGEIAAGR
jgi:selenocysteine lyase/cysteine desulfurase